jgi:predicted nucleotide-binding protein
LLKTIFNNELIAKEYSYASGSTSMAPDPIWGNPFPVLYKNFQNTIDAKLNKFESIIDRLELFPTELNKEMNSVSVEKATTGNYIFIGHGGSKVWKDLKDFINDRLNLSWDEFNRESPAGVTTKDRLEEMLNRAKFAFLIMTAEDEQSDGKKYSRQNVVHEIGLFQGRLGFTKAIVLLEDGCEEFSNIIGLGQIRFPQNDIEAKFEEIRKVLEREKII